MKLKLILFLNLVVVLFDSSAQVTRVADVSGAMLYELRCGLNNTDNAAIIGWNDPKLNIIKFDSQGNTVYQKRTIEDVEVLCSIDLYDDTAYILTIDTIQNSAHYIISVLDPNGDVVNAVQIDSINSQEINHQLYVYENQIYFMIRHAYGFRAISFDKSLNINWDVNIRPNIAPNVYNGITALRKCSNGDILLCGEVGYQLGLVRISSSGNVIWSKNYEFDINYVIDSREIVETTDGSIYIVGVSWIQNVAPFITKIDAQGNMIWFKHHPELYANSSLFGIIYFQTIQQFGSYLHVEGYSNYLSNIKVILDMNGEIVESYSSNIGFRRDGDIKNNTQLSFSASTYSYDSLILEYASAYGNYCDEIALEFEPSVSVSPTSTDTNYVKETIQHGDISFTGNFNLINHNTTFSYDCGSQGDEQFLGVAEEESLEINIYPNPVGTYLYVETSSTDISDIKIYSITGQHIASYEFDIPSEIDVSNLSPGVYIIAITDDSGRQLKRKIIKR